MNATHILIVEDEAIVAADLAAHLERMGYEVTGIAASASEAMAIVQATHPDLVLMDIRLDGEMDGIEAADQILTTFNIPVVYLTAIADDKTIQRAKASLPFGYLVKPFQGENLRVTIEIALARYQAETQIHQALHRVQHPQEVQPIPYPSAFLTRASDQLRTPLSIVQGMTQTMQRYGHTMSEHEQHQQLAEIEVAVSAMNQLLDNLLMLGELATHRESCHRIAVDLIGFCQDLIESLQANLAEPYQLHFFTCGECPLIYWDDRLLWHLLHHLLSNAIKYSPDGGIIQLHLICDSRSIQFQVADQGIGIPLTEHRDLFAPFQRASNVGQIPGAGLGLAIVKQLVDLHRGQIWYRSNPAQGSTFTVTLPLTSRNYFLSVNP